MDELAAGGQGISFGNGKTRTGDRFFDAETFGETAHQGGFAGANIADETAGGVIFLPKSWPKVSISCSEWISII